MRKLIAAAALILALAGCSSPTPSSALPTGNSKPFLQEWINSLQGTPPPESYPVPNGQPVNPLDVPGLPPQNKGRAATSGQIWAQDGIE
jgi:hypothetical protein